MASKRSKNPASTIGIAAVIASLVLTFVVTYAFINLKWVLKWEKENKRKQKIKKIVHLVSSIRFPTRDKITEIFFH